MRDRKYLSRAVLALAAVFSLLYFACSFYSAWKKGPWADEIFVIWILRSFPAGQFAHAVAEGADSVPPGYLFLLKGLTNLFGLSCLTIRAPSIIAFYLFLISIFCLLRPRFGASVSSFAAALACLSAAGDCAVWARPYAIVSASMGFATLLWTNQSLKGSRIWRACLIAFCLAVANFVHFYSVMIAATIALMELLWALHYRRIRAMNWIAIAAGGASMLMWFPVMGAIHERLKAANSAPGFYARPGIQMFLEKWGNLFFTDRVSELLLIFACGLLFFCCTLPLIGFQPSREPEIPREDSAILRMVALAVMLLPVATFFFAEFVTKSLNTRYFFSAVLALSLLFSMAVHRLPFVKPVSAFAFIALAIFFYKDNSIRNDDADSRLQILADTPKLLPILVSEASDYFELMEAAPDPIRRRLVYSEMPHGFQHPDPEPQIIAKFWKKYRPELVVVTAEQFFPQTNDFYVLVTGGSREGMTDWIIEHSSVKLVKRDSELLLLEVDSPVR